MIVLKVKNIAKQFKMGDKIIQVLKDVNFSLRRGEIASILGVSGAGKSTLLSIIGTLDRPSGGTVTLEDKNITSFNENQLCELRNQKIGFIFQFHYLLPEFTALENVAMPGLIQRLPRKKVFEKAESLLREVGLSDRAEHKPNELSGGELQRVAVARSLVNDPVLVLADEPTGNLDRENGDAVYALMLKLSRDSGKTFLVVTHNETIAERTDRVLTLVDGVMI